MCIGSGLFYIKGYTMTFHKICKICNKEFDSDSKNKLYCSDKCSKRGAKRASRRRKMKAIHSPTYWDDKAIVKLIHKAYDLSREIANALIPKVCSCKDKDHICNGELECHHLDHDPLNMHPSNLVWLCKAAHAKLHSSEEDNNIFEELKAFVTIKEQYDIRVRNEEKRVNSNNTNIDENSKK